MATINEALKGINAYPIPQRTIEEIALRRGCALSDEINRENLTGSEFNLAKADILIWLSLAPNITQGGISYAFSDDQRNRFRTQANALYDEVGETEQGVTKPLYGYKGNRL